jgi:hypothetical protein
MITYWLITRMLAHMISVSRNEDLLGGMWAVVATVFVYSYSYEESVAAALSRMGRHFTELCPLFYRSALFPFHFWEMATRIGIGAVAMSLLGGPDDVVTTGITTAVVMVVGAISPDQAWKEPILRMVDTIAGVAVRVLGAWISLQPSHTGSTAA